MADQPNRAGAVARGGYCPVCVGRRATGVCQIRIADIDAPELGSPQCDAEFALGLDAEARLQQLLNAGTFRLVPTDSARDLYGRELFILSRGGTNLGKVMEDEGLAHPWVGQKLPWC